MSAALNNNFKKYLKLFFSYNFKDNFLFYFFVILIIKKNFSHQIFMVTIDLNCFNNHLLLYLDFHCFIINQNTI